MAKFRKGGKSTPMISTASLPDIVFMLLFFFMVTTVLRETDILVEQRIPKAEALNKIEKKSLVSYIFIGKPRKTDLFGSEPRIQVNDVLVDTKDIILFIAQEKDKLSEAERDQITVALKIDREAKMGVISDVQQKLRDANARKILYTSNKEVPVSF